MTRYALLAALIASLAAPAYADRAHSFAVQHLNQDIDTPLQRTDPREFTPSNVTISARTASSLGAAFEHFNMDADALSDRSGDAGATILSGSPLHGADIFERLAAESRGDS